MSKDCPKPRKDKSLNAIEDGDAGDESDAEDEGNGKNGIGEREGREFSDANISDHDSIRYNHEHLADLPNDQRHREDSGFFALFKQGGDCQLAEHGVEELLSKRSWESRTNLMSL